jgi:HPr kinase/phosphorylase
MPQIGVAQLFDDNADALDLKWVSGSRESAPFLDSADVNQSSQGLIGHLNLVHPNWIQIFSRTEAAYFSGLNEQAQREALERISGSGLVCIILSDGEQAPPSLADFGTDRNVPVIASPMASLQVIWVMRTYLGRALAEFVTRHGVLLDVLGMGVLLTGESGVGKSELALELISRGSGLVADDVVELYHIGPSTLEGRSPQLLTDFLEVRGLGMLNIRTIFGETAVRRRKNLKLIVGATTGRGRAQSGRVGRGRGAQLRATTPRNRQHPGIHPAPGRLPRFAGVAMPEQCNVCSFVTGQTVFCASV